MLIRNKLQEVRRKNFQKYPLSVIIEYYIQQINNVFGCKTSALLAPNEWCKNTQSNTLGVSRDVL